MSRMSERAGAGGARHKQGRREHPRECFCVNEPRSFMHPPPHIKTLKRVCGDDDIPRRRRVPPPLQSEEDVRGREAELSEGLRSASTPHVCLLCRQIFFLKGRQRFWFRGRAAKHPQRSGGRRRTCRIHPNLGSGASFDWTATILSVVSDDDGVKQDAELFSRSRPGVWRSEPLLLLWLTVPEIGPFFRNTPPPDPALIRIY